MADRVRSGSSSTSFAISLAGLGIGALALAAAAVGGVGCATGITDGTTTADAGGNNEHLLGEIDGSNADLNNGEDSGSGSDSSAAGDDDQAVDGSLTGDDGATTTQGDDSGNVLPTDSGGASDSGGSQSACATQLAAASFDFNSSAQGWTHGISDGAASQAAWPYDPWTQGVATSGPACPSGSCFGAELTENYAQCQRGYLLSPEINLSACSSQTINLSFSHLYSFWTNGTYADGGIVEISPDNGNNWHTLTAPTGVYSGTVAISPSMAGAFETYSCVLNSSGDFHVDGKAGWIGSSSTVATVSIPIPAALVTSEMLIRFSFGSGVSSETNSADTSRSGTSTGWRVDNVAFVAGM